MTDLMRMVALYVDDGYSDLMARARVCQDVVLKAIAESSISKNVTIKGGVVMRSITGNTRRATRDIDLDFLRFSIEESAIRDFVMKINCLDGISIDIAGPIEELSQQEYRGKRLWVVITDSKGHSLKSKMDLGVHKNIQIEQEEYCFDIACYDGSATLLINSKEQMFTEKLRSLLKFGPNSTRYKDIFDMFYLTGKVDIKKLLQCLDTFVISDPGMKENDMNAVVRRITRTFSSKRYIDRLTYSKKNWIGEDIPIITASLLEFLKSLDL